MIASPAQRLIGRLPRRLFPVALSELSAQGLETAVRSRICRFTSLRRSATVRMWALAASAAPGATVSAGCRKIRDTSAAAIRRMRCAFRMRSTVLSRMRAALVGVGTAPTVRGTSRRPDRANSPQDALRGQPAEARVPQVLDTEGTMGGSRQAGPVPPV